MKTKSLVSPKKGDFYKNIVKTECFNAGLMILMEKVQLLVENIFKMEISMQFPKEMLFF